MPEKKRPSPSIAEGLFDRANPLQISDAHASHVRNVMFNRLSAEQCYGYRKLHADRPKMGAIHFDPAQRVLSIKSVTRWRDGYAYAPTSERLQKTPQQIDYSVRLEEQAVFPASGTSSSRMYGGISGRYQDTFGTQRAGGEHQFFPCVALGAREVESPDWCAGVGVVKPEGLRDNSGNVGEPDRVTPVFYWWDATNERLNVAAADLTIQPGVDYHITMTIPSSGSGVWYVNGVAQTSLTNHGLSALPNQAGLTTHPYAIYFGRCYTRAPDIAYSQVERKHAFMGKLDLNVDAVTATTITITGEQLGFTGAPATSYVNYRVRVLNGTDANRVYTISAAAFTPGDTWQFTIPTHGIVVGDDVDIIPQVEPIPAEASVQEVRVWETAQTPGSIANMAGIQAVSDPRDQSLGRKPMSVAGFGDGNLHDLIAYWPMNDDGGTTVRDLVGESHGVFGPSLIGIVDQGGGIGPRECWLDGETTAIQVDMRDEPNLDRNLAWNLGRDNAGDQHWNFCARMAFRAGSCVYDINAGSITDHIYEVLFSIGAPGESPLLECRMTRFGSPSENRIYFVLPDGTTSTLPSGQNPVPGTWYNAIVGIEALTDGSDQHYVYFQSFSADRSSYGSFSSVITLGDRALDPSTEYLIAFGSSVSGTQDKGSQRKCHALLGLSVLGYGFHPAHTANSLAASALAPFMDFGLLESREEAHPPITGRTSGGTYTKGSRDVVTTGADDLQPGLRRWPIAAAEVELVLRREDRADVFVSDHLVIDTVSSSTASLLAVHQGETVRGATVRAVLWSGYTNFGTIEPAFDLDLNAGRDSDSDFAITDEVFRDIAESAASFDWAIDPAYEFLSPHRVAPTWSRGLVTRFDIEVASVHQFKTDDGLNQMLFVAGGSLHEADDRWRRGRPWDHDGYCLEFRVIGDVERRRLERSQEGLQIYNMATKPLADDALEIPATQAYLDPAEDFSSNTGWTIEADVNLESVEGLRTIGARSELSVTGGAWSWKKNWHLYLDDGVPKFEIRDDAAATLRTVTANRAASSMIRPGTWHRVRVVLVGTGGGTPQVTSAQILIDGRQVTTTFSGAFNVSTIPAMAGTPAYAGAIGQHGVTSFVHGLGGMMAGFQFHKTGDPAEFDPLNIITSVDPRVWNVPMDEGKGLRLGTSVTSEVATQVGRGAVWLGGGIGDSTGRAVSFSTFQQVAYLTNGITRPWRWDGVEFTPAGLRPPAGKLRGLKLVRKTLRVKDLGAEGPDPSQANRTEVASGAAPNLLNFTGAAPVPSTKDVGALVVIPSDQQMGAATDMPQPYIGVIQAIDSATPGYALNPSPGPEWVIGGGNTASYSIFRRFRATQPTAARAFLEVLAGMESTTPWGASRLLPTGQENNDIPRVENRSTLGDNGACIHLRGNQFIEIAPFILPGGEPGPGRVLDFKGYIRLDTIDVYGDDEMVVFERATDAQSGSYRIVVFGGGRLRFEFFDTSIADFRSIQTVGRCVTANQWYYLRFRYKYKDSGLYGLDLTGGWEPDLRWSYKTAAAGQLQKDREYRDGLWIYACEGLHRRSPNIAHAGLDWEGDVDEAAPCPLFVVPGCKSYLGETAAITAAPSFNHSQALLNGGLLKSSPFLTPERGDTLFPANSNATVDSGIIMTVAVNAFTAITNPLNVAPNCSMPAGFALPRSCSMNRDDPVDYNGNASASTQVRDRAAGANWWNQATAAVASTNVTNTPNLANSVFANVDSYGKKEPWAVIVRVWAVETTTNASITNGDLIDAAAGSAQLHRTLALVHVGTNDLGNGSRGGTAGHSVHLTDDVRFGGDGGGALQSGGNTLNANDTVHATFELPNGENQSDLSTNRLVTPCLLEHGTNPVGVGDAPDQSLAVHRLGGTVDQAQEGKKLSGLRGRLDDVGFLLADVVSSASNIYTADCMPPDCFFNGPVDTRVLSLPRLVFRHNALIQDDVTAGYGGSSATGVTIVLRADELAGKSLIKGAESNTRVPQGRLVSDGDGIQTEGVHRLRVTLYDPRQLVESNPGEEQIVRVDGDEGSGDFLESESSFVLEGVPLAGDRRERLWRRVYKTLGGGATPLLWVQIEDNSTTQVTPRSSNLSLAIGRLLRFDNQRPPVCEAIRASETNMAYAGLSDAPNVMVISKAFKPEHVDFAGSRIVFTESGKGGGIVGVGFVKGQLVPGKRNAVFVVVPSGSLFRTTRVGQSVGPLSHQSISDLDNVMMFAGQKGIYGFAGNLSTYDLSAIIEEFYRKTVDLAGMSRSHSAAHLERNQWWLSVKTKASEDPSNAIVMERRTNRFGDRYSVFTIVEPGIPMFAVTDYEERLQDGAAIAVGARGFVMRADVGVGVGVGAESAVQGALIGVVNAASDTVKLVVDLTDTGLGGIDTLRDGLAGVPFLVVEELDVSGTVTTVGNGVGFRISERGEIAKAESVSAAQARIYPMSTAVWSSHVGRRVLIGGFETDLRSRWYDLSNEEDHVRKRWEYLDLAFDRVDGGFFYVEIYQDMDESAPTLYFRVPMDVGYYSIFLAGIHSRFVQFRVRDFGLRTGIMIHRAEVRATPTEIDRRHHE